MTPTIRLAKLTAVSILAIAVSAVGGTAAQAADDEPSEAPTESSQGAEAPAEEPAPEPVVEEPAPEPVAEEPAPEPVAEEPVVVRPVTVWVSSSADSGPKTFRAAVDAANSDPTIERIAFRRRVAVELQSSVVYAGTQNLLISGRRASVSGATAPISATWDGGLFVSTSAADLDIRSLTFSDSFNNGIAVMLPATAGDNVSVSLTKVTVTGSAYHGIYIDGANNGLVGCADPHAVDSDASVSVNTKRVEFSGNGTAANSPALAGCSADFDGLHVEEGGLGDVTVVLQRTEAFGNSGDGVAVEESDVGAVVVIGQHSSLDANGGNGFLASEAGEGNLNTTMIRAETVGNGAVGLRVHESGTGDTVTVLRGGVADNNDAGGVDIDEHGIGTLAVELHRMNASDSANGDGIALNEHDDGFLSATFFKTNATDNAGRGIAIIQTDIGGGQLFVQRGDFRDNGGTGVETLGLDSVQLIRVKQ